MILKPCPFCGSNNIRKASFADINICFNCGASGPVFLYSNNIWNDRVDEKRVTGNDTHDAKKE